MTVCIRLRAALLVLAVSLAGISRAGGAQVTIVNGNEPGVGFNDPTPATPVGGNTGTTVGEQRLIAFQHVAGLWSALIESPVEIRVHATFEPLSCTADTAVLGAASPTQAISDFPNAPLAGTWYAVALANRISAEKLNAGGDDITARFNSNLGATGCFEGSGWYYGLDNDHGGKVDLVAVVLHEIAHGLGFLTFVTDQGVEFQDQPDVFERQIFDTAANKHWSEMTTTERGASVVNTGHLTWDGPAVTAMAPSFLGGTPALTIDAPASLAANFVISTAQFGPDVSEEAVTGQIVAAIDPADASGMTIHRRLLESEQCLGPGREDRADRPRVVRLRRQGRTGPGRRRDRSDRREQRSGGSAAAGRPRERADDRHPHRRDLPGGRGRDPRVASLRRDRAHPRECPDALRRGRRGKGPAHAPNPDEPGSSISHWDTSAFPSLLMEPNLTAGLPHTVDLTLPLLRHRVEARHRSGAGRRGARSSRRRATASRGL